MKTITIENKAAKIRLDQEVDGEFIRQLLGEIGEVYAPATAAFDGNPQNAADTLEIEINSPGGSIFDGYNLFAQLLALRQRGVYVTATITGLAASMASVIAMAADHIRIVPMGRIMIHDASGGLMGNAEALFSYARVLDGISADIAVIYSARTGIPETEVRAMMKRETWIKAAEALALRFVDEVLEVPQKALTDNLIHAIRTPNSTMNFIDAIKRAPELEKKIGELEAKAASLMESQAAMEVRATTAESALNELGPKLIEATASNVTLTAQLAAAQAALKDHSDKIVDLTARLAAKDGEVSTAREGVAKQVATQAAAVVASMGHAQVPVSAKDSNQGALELKAQFLALTDPVERAKFWAENKKSLIPVFHNQRN